MFKRLGRELQDQDKLIVLEGTKTSVSNAYVYIRVRQV